MIANQYHLQSSLNWELAVRRIYDSDTANGIIKGTVPIDHVDKAMIDREVEDINRALIEALDQE